MKHFILALTGLMLAAGPINAQQDSAPAGNAANPGLAWANPAHFGRHSRGPSPISIPSQMKVWLWILQAAPITAPRWISTKVPIRLCEPIRQP